MVYLVLEIFILILQVHIFESYDIQVILQQLTLVFQFFGGLSFVLVLLGLGLLDFVEVFWKLFAGFQIADVGAGVCAMYATCCSFGLLAIDLHVSDHVLAPLVTIICSFYNFLSNGAPHNNTTLIT